MSSGESELYAALKAAAETLGVMSMLKDLHWEMEGKIYGDASAALGIINRIGLGKTRHIDTSLFWIQQTAAERHLAFAKVLGQNNPAELYTKYLDQHTSDIHVRALNYHFTDGRSDEAFKLHTISSSRREHASKGNLSRLEMVTSRHRGERLGKSTQRISQRSEQRTTTIDGLRTMGAPGFQTARTGVERLERRRTCPSLGIETRGDHAPEGAIFEGRQDPMVP